MMKTGSMFLGVRSNTRVNVQRTVLLAIIGVSGCESAEEAELSSDVPLAAEELSQSVAIESVTAIGSGCPSAGTYSVKFAADRSTFTVDFADFDASTNSQAGYDLESCAFAVKIKGQEGIDYAPVTVSWENTLDLQRGTTATLATDAYWIGSSGENASSSTSYDGPREQRHRDGRHVSRNRWPRANLVRMQRRP